MKNSYRWFSNKTCKYYPCHPLKGDINCLFCYCPLYHESCCGGNFVIVGEKKDCSECSRVHIRSGYEWLMKQMEDWI